MRLASIELLISQCEEQIKFAERPSRINSLKLLEVAKEYTSLIGERDKYKALATVNSRCRLYVNPEKSCEALKDRDYELKHGKQRPKNKEVEV
jgi:hypothetical protein